MTDCFFAGTGILLGHGGRKISMTPFDVRMPNGKLTALIGPNGGGKTTLLKAFLGEDTLLDGKISVSGLISFVPQEHRFPPSIRLNDFLRLAFLRQAGWFGRLIPENHPEIVSILREFNLDRLRTRPLERLSTGERQRAFLARAVLQKSNILVLDEPTNHLDPGGVRRFWLNLLESRKKKKLDIVVSTHDLSFVENFCDWVCAMKQGQMFFSGPTNDCFAEKIPSKIFDY